MNPKLKEFFISTIKFLNTKPVFRRIFYWVHEIRKNELKTDRFLAVELDQGFFIGTYKHYRHVMWRRLAEEDAFEADGTETIKKILPHFDFFIDVGAHIGYYTCLVHKLAPEIPIFSFEPNPENFKSLKKNREINGITKGKAFNIGLGQKKDKMILYGIDGMGSVVKETYDTAHLPEEQTEVDIDTLDTFTKDIPDSSKVFIKVDIEGNEFNFLKGAEQFIKKVRPIGLMMEICPRWSVRDNPHYEETFKLLEKLGYEARKIEEGNFLVLRKDIV